MIDFAARSLVVAWALCIGVSAARADIVDIAWDASGGFDRRLNVAPGKLSELCGKLLPSQTVQWQFESDRALDFNIHYHETKTVLYPVRADQVRSREGTLAVPTTQDYCWMWTNKSTAAARLRVQLRLK